MALRKKKRGTTHLYLVGAIAVLTILTSSVLLTAMHSFAQSARMKETFQCLQLSRAGIVLAKSRLEENPDYTGEGPVALSKGEFQVTVKRAEGRIVIISTGYFPNVEKPRRIRTLEREYMP